MARSSKYGNSKVVDATTTVTWAVSNDQFRRLARTGEFAPPNAADPEIELQKRDYDRYGTTIPVTRLMGGAIVS